MDHFTSGDFSSFGLPLPSSMPSAGEVQQEARERSTDVLLKWNRLRQILERHEDVIRKRWSKKSKSSRTHILFAAWPNMSLMHRPDYAALMREGRHLKTRKTNSRVAYMWPYINVEDLVKRNSLLLFMNSRGRHAPHMFARADFEAMRIGHISGAVMPAFLNLHTMFLDGEEVETYGRLVAWDDDDDAMMEMMSGLQYHPGEGLLILEIQQQVLKFLVECCQGILHDIDPIAIIDEFPIKPEPSVLTDSSDWPLLATVAAEAPYRLPAQLNVSRLIAIVEAQRASAEDHIRSLREDPGYFSDTLVDWSEHRQEKILSAKQKAHPILKEPLFWDRTIGNVITDAYGALIMWSVINEQLVALSALQEKYASIITPQESLPPEYIKALLALRYTLSQAKNGPILNLKTGFPASPPLRSLYVREPAVPGSNMIRVQTKSGQDRLNWLFSGLWDDQQLHLLGFPSLIDEIEHLTQSNPEEKAKLSSWVARVFADLGVISRIRHELDIYQPWAAGFDYEHETYKTDIQKEFAILFASAKDIVENTIGTSLSTHGAPTDGRFYYPSDKRRTKQNTDSMRSAERNLDFFWAKVDSDFQRKSKLTLNQAVADLFTDNHQLERTPEWVDLAPTAEQKALPEVENELQHSLSSVRLQPNETQFKFDPQVPKTKSKTRGSTSVANVDLEHNPPAPTNDIQPRFVLKKRALHVFKALFFQPSQPNLPGDIPWADFLYAMAATGFVPEKLYGSVWQFTPTKLDVERGIQFHEPHPIAKIPFRNARRIGRRLSRVYGWHGGMFVLE